MPLAGASLTAMLGATGALAVSSDFELQASKASSSGAANSARVAQAKEVIRAGRKSANEGGKVGRCGPVRADCADAFALPRALLPSEVQQAVHFSSNARAKAAHPALRLRDVLHNSLRSVIARPRAVRCVAFLTNSLAIGCEKTPCGLSRSALPPTREGYAGHP